VKVDILAHRYRYIQEPEILAGIQMLSEPDIVAMKLNAIATSGQRSKDFIDIFYLLDHYDIGDMLAFYKTKYDQQNDTFLLKSLIYFDEVDLSDWPVLLNPDLKWNEVKRLVTRVMQYVKTACSSTLLLLYNSNHICTPQVCTCWYNFLLKTIP
jgi:hypothetical protein